MTRLVHLPTSFIAFGGAIWIGHGLALLLGEPFHPAWVEQFVFLMLGGLGFWWMGTRA